MAKEAFYFPHDYNAQRDPKIGKLLRAHGWEAYGLYWAIIERLYEQGGRISEDYELISYELRTDPEKVKAIIGQFALFFTADGMIGCKSVDRRLDERRERQEIARQNGIASARARSNRSTTVEQPLNDRSADPQLERKEKESKEKKGERVSGAPTLNEVREWAKRQNSNVSPERFFNFYSAVGWKIKGDPIVDWKALFARWQEKDGVKPAPQKLEAWACRDCGNGNTEKRADWAWDGALCERCASEPLPK